MNNNNNALTIGFFGILALMLFGLVLFFLKVQDSRQNLNQQPIIIDNNDRDNDNGHRRHNFCPPNQPNCPPNVNPAPIPPCQPPVDYIGEARRLYILGYEDGSRGIRPDYRYKDNVHYIRGYRDGARHCPSGIQFQIGIDLRD